MEHKIQPPSFLFSGNHRIHKFLATSSRSGGFFPQMKLLLFTLALTVAQPVFAQRNRVDNAPKVGDAIPKISVVTLANSKKVDLSKPEKPTVLIFGSHT